MAVKVTCPSCAEWYSVKEDKLGSKVKCANCQSTFTAAAAGQPTRSDPPRVKPKDTPPPSSPAKKPEPPGKQLGKFQITETLGEGAFGTVYKAHDTEVDRDVALKIPKFGALATEEDVQRFLREARAAGNLHHPHIVPVFEAGRTRRTYYIASGFIDGETLESKLKRRERLTHRQCAELVAKIATALHYAHTKGIVHRDIKPANIMMDAKVEMLYIEPGSPWENGYAESFFSRLRDELLNCEEFTNLAEARWFAERRREEHNQERPHSSLGYQTPSEFAKDCTLPITQPVLS